VRLAQRVPVRVALDHVPDGVQLLAGRTATVVIEPREGTQAAAGLWPTLAAWLPRN
jgi:multidrug resistance efflux pump